MGLAAVSVAAAQPDPGSGVSPQAADAPTLAARLSLDPGPASDEVARRLRDPELVRPTLEALAALPTVPPTVWRDVSVLTTSDQDSDVRVLAARVVARFATREAVTLLVRLAADETAPVASEARQGLFQLTGLGPEWDAAAWKAWLESTADWTDRTWTRTLLASQAEARRRLESERDDLRAESVALYRRLHVELDPTGRTTLIAELIRDDRVWLRDLGFDLAGRDISARTGLGEEVARAAAERLLHPEPDVRAMAANLVSRLVPPDAMILLTEALAAEKEARAAEPMLLGVARWPNPDAVEPAITWLERNDAPIDAASTALWAFTNAGYLESEDDRARVLARLRGLRLDRTGEPGMRMLVRLGGEEDLNRVAELLSVPDGPLRSAAAEALCESPEGTRRLLALASEDPRLFPPTARAVTRHEPTPEGLRAIAGLPTIQPVDRARALLAHAEALPPERLDEAVRMAGLDDELGERVLARLGDADGLDEPGVFDGLLTLAEIRMRLGRPDAAGEAIAPLLDRNLSEAQAQRLRRVRIWRRLSINDPDGAWSIEDATAADWLAAMRNMPEPWEARGSTAARVLERFEEQLDAESRAAFESMLPMPDSSDPEAGASDENPEG